MYIFHRDVFVPPTINWLPGHMRLTYSKHSLDQAYIKDIDNLPQSIYVCKDDIVEYYMVEHVVFKILVRVNYSVDFDICMPILIPNHYVKTVWLNSTKDTHTTLDTSKYSKCYP